jgi:uroporphyrinogen-III decarboxylase
MMTTKERVVTALNHQEPDRVPIWTLIDNAGILEHFAPEGFDFDRLRTGDSQLAAIELTAAAARGLGVDVTFVCDYWAVNPFPREASDTKTIGPERERFHTPDDLDGFTPEVRTYDDFAEKFVPTFQKYQAMLEPDTILVSQTGSPVEAAHGELGLELFSLAIYDRPDDVRRLLDAYTESLRITSQVYADNIDAPAYQVSCDVGFKGSTLFSPEFLKRELMPRLKYQLEPVKQAGMKVILHSDGDITDILGDLIDAGIDGVNPLEPTAGMDLGKVKRRFGDRLTLVGNGDVNIAMSGTPDQIEADARRCVRDGAPGGGYFFDMGAGEIFPGIPVENVLCMIDAIHRYGDYPLGDV